MIGYSEVIQTMAAMVVFSVILLNANRMILRNNVVQVEGELEQETVAIAQDIIEESRTKKFDQVTVDNSLPPLNIPGDFTAPSALGQETSETNRSLFNDFDDYNGWQDSVTTRHGTFNVKAVVYYADPNNNYAKSNTPTTFKKIQVFVYSTFLRDNSGTKKEYKFEYIRNYYAD